MNANSTPFEKMYLHDAEIININYDYEKETLAIILKISDPPNTPKKHAKLIFNGVKIINIDATKPWGEGIYIFEHELVANSSKAISGCQHYRIKTNAGDTFDVIAKKVILRNLE